MLWLECIMTLEIANFKRLKILEVCIPKKSHLHRSPAIAYTYQRTIKASKTILCPNIFQCRCIILPIGYIYDFNISYSWQLSWIKLDQACWVAFWYIAYSLKRFNITFYLIWVRQKDKKVRNNSYTSEWNIFLN